VSFVGSLFAAVQLQLNDELKRAFASDKKRLEHLEQESECIGNATWRVDLERSLCFGMLADKQLRFELTKRPVADILSDSMFVSPRSVAMRCFGCSLPCPPVQSELDDDDYQAGESLV
jgi:hypothetical protein